VSTTVERTTVPAPPASGAGRSRLVVGGVSGRTLLRWGVRHGIAAVYLHRAARRGDLVSRLFLEREIREQPYDVHERLRARGPFSPSALGLATTSHAVAEQVLKSEHFGVGFDTAALPRPLRRVLEAGDELEASGVVDPPSMLVVDPPEHTRFRRLVSRDFTPRAIAAFEPLVQETADALLDRLAGRVGEVELVDAFIAQLPVLVIARLLGVPTERREEFLRWGEAAAATLDPGLSFRRYVVAERALRALHGFLREHFERLRREPGEDLVSRLVHLEGEDRLTERELHSTVMLLLGAGFETTVNLLGNAVVLLDRHRDQRDALLADPTGWPNAVEEVLRYDSPVQVTGRTAQADVQVGGRTVRAGTRVTLLLGAANRDPGVFADPARFDTTRANAREHLAFSAGIHYCVGAGLARLEGVVGLRTLTERFPALRVSGRPVRRDLRTLRGFERLPVTLS
jgi:cytochrome P450